MILTVDIGNSNIVLGGFAEDKLSFRARLRSEKAKTADEYMMDLKGILDVYEVNRGDVDGAIIASVAPAVTTSMQSAIARLTGKTALVVGPGIKTGLNIRLDDPAQMGADLVAADVAALRLHKAPMILVDMGTATTFAVLDAQGAHIGGCVCPGVRISLEALTNRAALLPAIQLDKPKKTIGRNTLDAMRSGVMYGHACMIDGMVDRICEELGEAPGIIATGGIARHIVPLCSHEISYDADLVLKGLYFLYQDNTRRKKA